MDNQAKKTDMMPLRNEIRALLPVKNTDPARTVELNECVSNLKKLLDDYTAAHPNYDALELRRLYYSYIAEAAPLYIYRNSPFYYEAAINGGWFVNRPAAVLKRYTVKFMQEHIPQEEEAVYRARLSQRFILCCGFFTDEIHHIPPLQNILSHGFKYYHDKALAELERLMEDE